MNKKDLGAFYTPQHIVEYMLGLLSDLNERATLLEPCGGDGAFISVVSGKKLLKPNQITVWDINPEIKNYIEKFGVTFNLKDSLLETTFKEVDLFN
ncbi:N-6 DNA methylase, partial [Patescibacteria group bacterium]|nr:N-6 DNA methylase [Patescibacteria group bacterium]